MRVLVVTVVHHPLDARIHRRQLSAMRRAGWAITYAAPWTAFGVDPRRAGEGVVTRDLPRARGRHRLAAMRAVRRLVTREGAQHHLVLIHDPELVLAVRVHRADPLVVLDVHEDLPASLVDRDWIPARLRSSATWFARRLERYAERHLGLLLAEEAYAERFLRTHPVVRNVPPLPPDPPPPAGDRVVYLGRVSRGRGAMELIRLGWRLSVDGLQLEVIGPADADVQPMLAAAHSRGELTWRGWLPNETALERLSGALAGISLLHDLPNYRHSTPTKVVEYLASGLPVVTTPLPRARTLVEEADAGLVVPYGDDAGAASAVRSLRRDPAQAVAMGRRGREHVARHHAWDQEQEVFLEALAVLAARWPTS